jgi:hypothetical protein
MITGILDSAWAKNEKNDQVNGLYLESCECVLIKCPNKNRTILIINTLNKK